MDVESAEAGGASGSFYVLCRSMQEQMKRVEQRLVMVEKKQDKLSDTLKDILGLVKQFKKESFSIKGSPYEVC